MSKATDQQWRVQQLASTGNWISRGLFETRAAARLDAKQKRWAGLEVRVIPYVKPQKVRK
jgi:hypothetical protein